MPNPVVRWRILSPDPEKSSRFYEKLFSWKSSQANALGYRELSPGDPKSINGGVWPAPEAPHSFV